ncbi:MAG TPA: hypothetical protein VIL64_01240, partial [Solirubrobacteraceae bacterium]
MRRRRVVLGALAALLAVPVAGAAAKTRSAPPLVPLTGAGACVSLDQVRGCAHGRGFTDPTNGSVLSNDGRTLYVPSVNEPLLGVVSVDPASGRLSQPPGAAGCLASSEGDFSSAGAAAQDCARVPGVMPGNAAGVAVSPDDRFVYLLSAPQSSHDSTRGVAIAAFARSADGSLTPVGGAGGCLSTLASAQCSVATLGTLGVSISPDGRFVYVGGHPLVVLARDAATGTLTPAGTFAPPSGEGLFAPAFTHDGRLAFARGVTLSVSKPDSVFSLTRNVASGMPAVAACATLGRRTGCTHDARLGPFVRGIAPSPDGRRVFVSATPNGYRIPPPSGTPFSLAAFGVNPSTGALAPAGCLSSTTRTGCTRETRLGAVSALALSPHG